MFFYFIESVRISKYNFISARKLIFSYSQDHVRSCSSVAHPRSYSTPLLIHSYPVEFAVVVVVVSFAPPMPFLARQLRRAHAQKVLAVGATIPLLECQGFPTECSDADVWPPHLCIRSKPPRNLF